MPRYIDAEALENRIKAEWAKQEDEKGYGLAHFFVETQPTADVTPIVHAHWINRTWDHLNTWQDVEKHPYRCSSCRTKSKEKTKRCNECGAKMDEEVKENV